LPSIGRRIDDPEVNREFDEIALWLRKQLATGETSLERPLPDTMQRVQNAQTSGVLVLDKDDIHLSLKDRARRFQYAPNREEVNTQHLVRPQEGGPWRLFGRDYKGSFPDLTLTSREFFGTQPNQNLTPNTYRFEMAHTHRKEGQEWMERATIQTQPKTGNKVGWETKIFGGRYPLQGQQPKPGTAFTRIVR
jgi:hypothetical protein